MANALMTASVVSVECLDALVSTAHTSASDAIAGIARIAADILGVPLAAVAVADGERLRFLADVGFTLADMPLSASLLMPRLGKEGPLSLADMQADPQFRRHPLVAASPLLRFVAAAPLKMPDGTVLGFVAGFDTEPRTQKATALQLRLLGGLADQALAHLAAQGREQALRRQLEEKQRCLDAIANQALVGVIHQNFEGRIISVNRHFCTLTGRSAEELQRRPFEGMIHHDDWKILQARFHAHKETGEGFATELRWIHPDGSMLWCRANIFFVQDDTGRPASFAIFMHDITALQDAKAALVNSEERFRLATKAARLGVADFQPQTSRFNWSDELRAMLGAPQYASPSLRLVLKALEPDGRDQARLWLRRRVPAAFNIKGPYIVRIRRLDTGEPRWLEVCVWSSPEGAGDPVGEAGRLVITTRDVTDEKNSEERILWAAEHDPLTGLANRRLFVKRLNEAVLQAEQDQTQVGLLLFDLDKLKQTNDTLGHEAGDFLLRTFVDRLDEVRREGDTLARLGGDEFALIMPGLTCKTQMLALAQTLLDRMREPLIFGGRPLECRASIGACMYPAHGRDANSLQRNADVALYRAKAQGRCRLVVFEAEMRSELQLVSSMLEMARQALVTDGIIPYYQPKVALGTGTLTGFEALLRWQHPRRGIQGPGHISAAFEDLDLAEALSVRMFSLVATQMRAWLDAGFNFGHVAVNASAAEFLRDNFAERVLGQLEEAGVPPHYLELEVTESVLLGHQADRADHILRTLSNAGVRIALDDFGTGFASLSHLKRFPVDTIKIDRSFVRDLEHNAYGGAIIRAVISLGRSLGMTVVAEGIETQAQVEFLVAHQCDTGQGFFFGRPAEAAEIEGVFAAPAGHGIGDDPSL